jgi:SAM-dependent methyltransferase
MVEPQAAIRLFSSLRKCVANKYWLAMSLAAPCSPRRLYYQWKGYRFDCRYGIDTNRIMAVNEIGVETEEAQHATRYRATSVGFLRYLFKKQPVAFEDFVFVDLGSGKGRVLIEAAAFPFKRIIGVEFSKRLHLVAEELVARYEARNASTSRIELQYKSATEFAPPLENTIFYLYNPFDADILSKVMQHLHLSLRQMHRQILIVYLNPRWGSLIEATGIFALVDAGRYGLDEYRVYATPEHSSCKKYEDT